MDGGDINPIGGRNGGLMIGVVKDRPKRDPSDDDRALFVIDDVVAGIDEGFGDAGEGFDRDLLVRRRPTADLEMIAHHHPVKILRFEGFDPFAEEGASADGDFLDQSEKRSDPQSAVREAIRFADRTR